MTAARSFDPAGLVLVEEACRLADRLEKLDGLLRGDVDEWCRLQIPRGADEYDELVVVVNQALAEARQQANALRQIVATLTLGKAGAPAVQKASILDQLAERRAKGA